MLAHTIKKYLRPYRILSRWTTFNGAIQHALSLADPYDEIKIRALINELGQEFEKELRCVYCGAPAATWDHLHNNVKNGKFSGYGNRIFNLVPACRTCNEQKGSKSWQEFVATKQHKSMANEEVRSRLRKVEALNRADLLSWEHIKKRHGDLAGEYEALQVTVRDCLEKMDEIATKIRERLKKDLLESATKE